MADQFCGNETKRRTNSKAHDGAAKSRGVGKRPRGVESEKNRASGKEEMKDATVPKGHCFVASEREDVAHVGVVPIGLIEVKVRCAALAATIF